MSFDEFQTIQYYCYSIQSKTIISYQKIEGNYDKQEGVVDATPIISYQKIEGNYDIISKNIKELSHCFFVFSANESIIFLTNLRSESLSRLYCLVSCLTSSLMSNSLVTSSNIGSDAQ